MSSINKKTVLKIVSLCDAGLCDGVGKESGVPGTMCVEAAVNYAVYGDASQDHPACVDSGLAEFKIRINDWHGWPSDKKRGQALKRIAIAQLGTNYQIKKNKRNFDFDEFYRSVSLSIVELMTSRKGMDVRTLHNILELMDSGELDLGEVICELGNHLPRKQQIRIMEQLIDICVNVLIRMKTPGSKYLYLVK